MPLLHHPRLFGCGLLVVAWLAFPAGAGAQAQPDVDRASVHVERAEFDEALGILDQVEAKGGLTHKDVLRLLEQKALVHLALGRRADAERTLRVLATLAPDHRFAPNTTPDLVTAFESVRRTAPPPVRLLVQHEAKKKAVVLRASAVGNASGLVQRVVLSVRVNGGPARVVPEGSTTVAVAPGDRVLFHAEGEGALGTLVETADQEYTAPREARSGVSPWWYVAGGAVLAVAAVVSIALVSGGSNDRTQPGRPSLEGR